MCPAPAGTTASNNTITTGTDVIQNVKTCGCQAHLNQHRGTHCQHACATHAAAMQISEYKHKEPGPTTSMAAARCLLLMAIKTGSPQHHTQVQVDKALPCNKCSKALQKKLPCPSTQQQGACTDGSDNISALEQPACITFCTHQKVKGFRSRPSTWAKYHDGGGWISPCKQPPKLCV